MDGNVPSKVTYAYERSTKAYRPACQRSSASAPRARSACCAFWNTTLGLGSRGAPHSGGRKHDELVNAVVVPGQRDPDRLVGGVRMLHLKRGDRLRIEVQRGQLGLVAIEQLVHVRRPERLA